MNPHLEGLLMRQEARTMSALMAQTRVCNVGLAW